ncbi:MAG: SurA N-terminal domain-containing protein [Alphaproteobacteria bacterium]|nr:SurA N-terminal domain-containing protein [Alphaproteobacteria bacterium]
MITKLRKAQDTWLAKLIFGITALSFMSLFGVSGYLSRAASNPAVIKVNDQKISMAEFNAQMDEQIRMARKIFGENMEISDQMRSMIAQELLQKNLSNMIIKEIAKDNKVFVSDDLVRNVIFTQPQFRDEDGRFNPARFHNFLSLSGWTEYRYIDALKTDIIRSFLVDNPVGHIKVADVLADLNAKAESQRKIFKYIEVDPKNIAVDRKMTSEEMEQFYNDFSADFMVPESRNITVLELGFDDIAKNISVDKSEIEEFYKNNIDRFVEPETREVLQMVFDNEKDAQVAVKEVEDGEDFYAAAATLAKQNREDTSLGFVSKDMLIEELSQNIFAAKKGDVLGPIQSGSGWHVVKVNDIKAASKVDDSVAYRQIEDALKTEKAYEDAYSIVKMLDDKIGAGATLEDLAKETGKKLKTVMNLTDETSSPYTETAFSYNTGEISQAEETDKGFVFVRVDEVNEAHPLDMKDAAPQIEKLWAESEKSAIAQEIVNDVMNDIDNGDSIEEIAARYNLNIKTTAPLTRSQSFAGLNQAQMVDLFNENLNTAKQVALNGKTVIAVAAGDASGRKLTEQDLDVLNRRLTIDAMRQSVEQLIDSYGKQYDIRIKYRQLGLSD